MTTNERSVSEADLSSEGARPSLATVAASAGVSVATVSKVVNGRADVGPETRARVQSLLEEHSYFRRKVEASNTTVELVLHGDPAGYALAVLDGVLDAGEEASVTVAVSVRGRRQRTAAETGSAAWVRSLVARGRSAVIDVVDDAHNGDLHQLLQSRLPLVVLDPLSLPRRDVPNIGTTNFAGGMTACQHLVELGHRKIAYLGAPAEMLFNQARMHGYRAALEAAGLPVPSEYVVSGCLDFDRGMVEGGRLLDLPDRPTAIFAATDESAAGVLEAARRRGLRVPEHLSVVGFDDSIIARLLSPPLTTIRQPLREMGRAGLRTALQLASGKPLDVTHIELATELVVRSSSAPPAS